MKKNRFSSVSNKLPTLESNRVILRKMLFEDASDMFEYSHNPEVPKYLTWYPHDSIEYTKAYLRYISQQYRTGNCIDWAIIHKETHKMIGTCGLVRIDRQNNSAELGYVINPLYQRQGIAPEAAWQVIKFGFEVMGLQRIEARYMIENTPSRKVMEKCHMSFEGVRRSGALVKDRYRDLGICAITKEDFLEVTEKSEKTQI